MKIPFFTTEYQDLRYGKGIREKIDKVIQSGNFILGDEVSEFEEKVKEYINSKYAIGVASGSDALFLSIKSLNISQDKEVITTPFTFFASVSCIVNNGLKPVFVDVNEDTYNIDPDLIEEKINKNTKIILPVDLFSQPANYDKINKLADKYNLKVIEDSAEAFGMKWNDIDAGLCGDIGVFSFYPTKTLGGFGDGGMVVTDNEEYANRIRCLRVHGARKKYHHKYIGINSRLDSIQAAVLNEKLLHIDEEIKERQKIFNRYFKNLKNVKQINFPKISEKSSPVWYVLNIKCENRDELQMYLKKKNVGTTIYYPKPIHLQKCFNYLGYKKGDFPITERLCNSVLALPIFIGMNSEMIDYVCDKIKEFYDRKN
jgi:dTDP-4-amino-4,6-dideoxygalactose transaminase